jgi:hypothetical protein
MDKELNYKMNKDRINEQFYIDRKGIIKKYTGDMYKEVISFHYEISLSLFPNIKYPDSPDDHALMKGLVLVGSSVYSGAIIKKRPTISQVKKLKELNLYDCLCFEHNNYWINFDKYQLLMKK